MFPNDSIRTYIKPENLATGLQWLFHNTWAEEKVSFPLPGSNETATIQGHGFKTDTGAGRFEFSTSLIFDLDVQIISAIQPADLPDDMSLMEEFKNNFESIYLQNGKIKTGPFNTSLTKLKQSNVYEIVFMPVYSQTARILEKSIAVKKWIVDLSIHADAVCSFIDLTYNGHKILYYKGYPVNFVIPEPEDIYINDSIGNFFMDCYTLDCDKAAIDREQASASKITILENRSYTLYVQNNRWFITNNDAYTIDVELTESQVQQFKKEGSAIIYEIYLAAFERIGL